MSTQKKTSPMKKCVFVDLSQSDDETLIDIDTRSNDGSAEIITADDIRAGVSLTYGCLLYTSPSPRDRTRSRMPSSA